MKKKSFFSMLVFATLFAGLSAQEAAKPAQVEFHGVDFSETAVMWAEETGPEFVEAFKGINRLMLSEPGKYDVGKFLGFSSVSGREIETAWHRAEAWDSNFLRDKSREEFSDEDLARILSAYPESETAGLLIVALCLDKGREEGRFMAVAFDGKTKEIRWKRSFSGEAGGFGLRNYWAGSLYDGLEKVYVEMEKEALDAWKARKPKSRKRK